MVQLLMFTFVITTWKCIQQTESHSKHDLNVVVAMLSSAEVKSHNFGT